jgi:hypothetical protein
LKMIENGVAKHQRKYGKTRKSAQRRSGCKIGETAWGNHAAIRCIFLVNRCPVHSWNGCAEKTESADRVAGA